MQRLIDRQQVLSLYRQIIKLHGIVLPKSQLEESNRAIRGMFDDYTVEIERKLAEFNSSNRSTANTENAYSDSIEPGHPGIVVRGDEMTQEMEEKRRAKQLERLKRKMSRDERAIHGNMKSNGGGETGNMEKEYMHEEAEEEENGENVDFETEKDPKIALEMVLTRAHSYIKKLERMVVNGKAIVVSDPDFWSNFYASLADQYQNATAQDETSRLLKVEQFFDKHADTVDRDWYCGYRDVVADYLPTFKGKERNLKKVLIVGNGVSRLPLEMWKTQDFGNLVVSDVSVEACKFTEQMFREMGTTPEEPQMDPNTDHYLVSAHKKRRKIQVVPCNVVRMPFPDESFDVIVDKGTLDCLYLSDMGIGEDDREEKSELDENDIKDEGYGADQIVQYQREVSRVLKKGGQWVIFSGYDLQEDEDEEPVLNHPDAGSPLEGCYDHDDENDVHIYRMTKMGF